MRRASVLSSGTVGAALEGVLAGRKAIAISFPFFRGFSNWSKAEVDDAIQVLVKFERHQLGVLLRRASVCI